MAGSITTNTAQSVYRAGGDINTCRFVKLDTSSDFTVLECGSGDTCFGVSQEGSKFAPIPENTSVLAGVSGDSIRVFGPGDICLIELAAAVTRGDRVKSGAGGKGMLAAAGDDSGGQALESGASGEKIHIRVRDEET